jgi:hypothetical protein
MKQGKRTRCPRPALSAAKSTTSPDLKLWTNCMKSTFVVISSKKIAIFFQVLHVFLYGLPFYRDYRKSSPRDSPPDGKKQV